MKIAFLIMAHNNVELLNDFIQQILRYDKADIFVHVDKKAENMITQIKKADRIHILEQHIDAAWGDYTQIKMIQLLLDEAYRFGEYDYYSLHSGVDMLIKPVNDLVEYLSKTRKYGYYDCSKLPAKNWGHGGGLERISLKRDIRFCNSGQCSCRSSDRCGGTGTVCGRSGVRRQKRFRKSGLYYGWNGTSGRK